ncbi:hypothetical protein [Algisphaera agarilytica]|uniref:PEP-CTERM protein-sorting domain-containing protein n=1 Tax=Algisphaera agarilytica TaxID=1385975 RepID=A0A7X0H6X5_9BACT|nr:hypothetical protein [Algisphaera agarilytica]MBB6430243.1 hypothetical protein [Algisphaera agarilytica]
MIFAVVMAGLCHSPALAAPYISEIILPAHGTTGVEIDGLDAAGATLLILNASRERLSVQHAITLPPADQTPSGRGLALITGLGWAAAIPGGTLQAAVVEMDDALFSDALPVALVLIHGQGTFNPGLSLGSGSAISGITPDTPIADWINFGSGTDTQARAVVQGPSVAAIQALGIADLPRPTSGTADVTALARALTEDGPALDRLVGGTSAGYDAEDLGLRDFAFTPGQQNPLVSALDEEPGHTPEPGVGACLALGVFLLGYNGRRSSIRPPRHRPVIV